MNFSSFRAGKIIETLGVWLEEISNLSRYGVFVKDLYIDEMREIHARKTPIKIAVKT